MKRTVHRRIACVAITFALLAICVYWMQRPSATEQQIEIELAKLRAEGHPTTAQELARMFPDPDPAEDATILFGLVFPVAKKSRSWPENPLFAKDGIGVPGRSQPLSSETMLRLRAFVEGSRAITNHWPKSIPPGTRFPTHWERGISNEGVIDLVAVRLTIQTLLAHAVLAAEDTNSAAAIDCLIKAFQVAAGVNYNASVPEHIWRHHLDNLVILATGRALHKVSFTSAELAALEKAIPFEPPGAWRNSITIDNCRRIQALDYVRHGGRIEDIVGEYDEPFWKRLLRRFQPGQVYQPRYRDSDFLLFLRTIPEWQSIASATPEAAPVLAEKVRARYGSNAVSVVGTAVGGYTPGPRVQVAHFEAGARISVFKTVLAIARHEAEKRMLPERLADLVPEYLSAVPLDSFDDQSLRFKMRPRGYVVYSIGADGADNGGLERTNASATSNYDVTFTVER